MNRKRMVGTSIIGALVTLTLLLIVTSVWAEPGERDRAAPLAPIGTISRTISYQGRLLDSGGDPVNGTQVMTFSLYAQPNGGTPLWTHSGSVVVDEGVLDTYLDIDPTFFDGRALWLGVQVEGEAEMTPRQPLRPVPYALSLRPGALISGNVGAGIALAGYGPVIGIQGESQNGFGLSGRSTNDAGVYGVSVNGPAGFFTSTNGLGVQAQARGTQIAVMGENLQVGYGGYFTSTAGTGLVGESGGGVGVGVRGRGPFVGVHGDSVDGVGLSGHSTNDAGVYGVSVNGPAGFFTSTHSAGVHANSQANRVAVIGENRGNAAGGYFTSTHGIGLVASSSDGHAFATLRPSLIQGPNPMQVALLRWYPAISTTHVFTVGDQPGGIAFDGDNIWVVNYGSNTVNVLRANSGEQVMTCTTGANPEGIAFDGVNMWVTNRMSNNVSVLRASDCKHVMTPTVGALPMRIAFDGTNMWVTNNSSNTVSVIRASDGTTVMTKAVDNKPIGIAFDGTNMWIANTAIGSISVLRASDGSTVETIYFSNYQDGPVALAFDGANMWVTKMHVDAVAVIRAADFVSVTDIYSTTGIIGKKPSAIAFDGANMWVVNEESDTVSIIRAVDRKLVATVPVGDRPLGIAFDGANMWITNNNDDTVSKR